MRDLQKMKGLFIKILQLTFFVNLTQASFVMKASSVILTVDPGSQPFLTRNSSMNPFFFFLSFIKNPVGPLPPLETPER
jgi:hypothetical protein